MSDVIPRERPPAGRGVYGWFQDRLNVELIWQALFIRKIPFGVNLLYTLGFASLALFAMQAVTGSVLALDAAGNLISSPSKFVAAVGVSDLVIVETSDALLVCSRERAQDVGRVVKWLEQHRLQKLL